MKKLKAPFIILFATSLIWSSCATDGITSTKWTDGFNAKTMSKPINAANPLIITLHGSSGGYLPDDLLRPLVQKGYDVVNLSYFGSKGLPERIELIPIEYIKGAVDHYRQIYPKRKIVLLGVSRGAELALLYGSYFKNINGIIAYSPSSIVLPESIYNSDPSSYQSSWTYQGKPIPFAPIKPLPSKGGTVVFKEYIETLLQEKSNPNNYTIKAENILCPVLLLSGEDDQIWPSVKMGKDIEQKLGRSRTKTVFHDIYPNVGHQFIFFGDDPVGKTTSSQSMKINGEKYYFPFGGSEQSSWTGMVMSRDRVFYFLNNFI